MSKASTFSLENSYAYQAYLLARALRKDFFRISKQSGIDLFPEQWFALYYIVNNPGQSQAKLAGKSFEDRPSLSRTLRSLKDKKLIASNIDKNDRRSSHYNPTAKGKDVYDRLVAIISQERERVFEGLKEKDFHEFQRIVKTLLTNMR